jgi:hypothetical protein
MKPVNNKIYSKTFLYTLFFKQNHYHKHGIFVHTLKVLYAVLKAKDYKFIATAIMHDFGKPVVGYQKKDDILVNEYSFTNHEEKSYQIIKDWKFISPWTKKMVRYHYLIIDMKNSKKRNDTKRYARLKNSWDSLDEKFIKDLYTFLKYDDYGKK